jgi:hypothetical protein
MPNAIYRDPCVITVNDVVAWAFRGLRQNDVIQGNNLEELEAAEKTSKAIVPR